MGIAFTHGRSSRKHILNKGRSGNVLARFDSNYQEEGPGIFRKIPQESLDELKSIFDITGATERFEKLEEFSKMKAGEMGIEFSPGDKSEYYLHVYNFNTNKHGKDEH